MIVINKQKCRPEIKCPLMRRCPSLAISMGPDGFPFINQSRCIRCQTCVRLCAADAVEICED